MTISKEEIKNDFARFIRHEAMRVNCSQDDVCEILKDRPTLIYKQAYNKAIDDVIEMLHSRTTLNSDIPISIVLKKMKY